jgi:Concanavalin A-like lectin/glucanases superfamily
MKYNIMFLFVAVCCLISSVDNFVSPAFAEELGAWTGKHARLAWVQDQGKGSDTFAHGKELSLYGFDSKDGKGERLLVKGVGSYFKPIFTPDGKHVIYSDRRARKMFLLNWETGKVEDLGSGVAVAIWQDRKPSLLLRRKTLWVYCFSGLQPENKYGTSQPLYRFPLHKPKKKELIWDKTNMAWSNVQLSRDGEVLGGLFPWPHGGVIQTETMDFKRYGRGCWTSLSPDNSKLLWIFDGLHRNVQIHDVKNGKSWKVNINGAPGIGGFEVYHPRWSNHPRYFVITGPYEKGDGGNKIGGGGDKVEVYVGRLDENAERVEDWIQVTHNKRADFYPDLWVEGGGKAQLSDTLSSVVAPVSTLDWPLKKENLVYVWEDMKAANQLSDESPIGFYQCNLALRGKALFSRNLTLQSRDGWGETGDAGVKIGKALADSNAVSIELFVTQDKEQQASFFSLNPTKAKKLSFVQDGESLVIENSLAKQSAQRLVWEDFFTQGKPVHLVMTIRDGQIELFKNGSSLGQKDLDVNFSKTLITEVVLGDKEGMWSGSIAHVAIYNQPVGSDAIQQNSNYCFNKSDQIKSIETLMLDAELLETSDIPAPDSIGAYRRALVVNSYLVKKVVDGQYDEEKVVVAEWAVLDRKVVKSYDGNDGVERLILEKFDDHPELEGERQMMDIFEPDFTMYYRLN